MIATTFTAVAFACVAALPAAINKRQIIGIGTNGIQATGPNVSQQELVGLAQMNAQVLSENVYRVQSTDPAATYSSALIILMPKAQRNSPVNDLAQLSQGIGALKAGAPANRPAQGQQNGASPAAAPAAPAPSATPTTTSANKSPAAVPGALPAAAPMQPVANPAVVPDNTAAAAAMQTMAPANSSTPAVVNAAASPANATASSTTRINAENSPAPQQKTIMTGMKKFFQGPSNAMAARGSAQKAFAEAANPAE